MLNKFGALFVLYNPEDSHVNNIRQRLSWYDKVYIYDNSEESKSIINVFMKHDNVKIWSENQNDGLAVAYNKIIDIAKADGIDWLEIFDQDSKIDFESVKKLKEYIESVSDITTAVVAPYVSYDGTIVDNYISQCVEWVINSGEFINIELINKNGIFFDENYFLDRLDRDFCKLIANSGMKIIQVEGTIMFQELGDCINGVNTHSPIRNYYIARNRLYYNRKFYSGVKRVVLNLLQTFRHIFFIIYVGNKVGDNFEMIKKGIYDYRHNKMGKGDL